MFFTATEKQLADYYTKYWILNTLNHHNDWIDFLSEAQTKGRKRTPGKIRKTMEKSMKNHFELLDKYLRLSGR